MTDNGNGAPVLTPQMRAAIRIALDRVQTARKLYDHDHSDQVARKLRTAESHVGQVEFVEALWARVQELEADLDAGQQFMTDHVEPLRELAMEISLKYEPCGFYCDPDENGGGHHDHKLFNWAKYLFGDGIVDYLPKSLQPKSEREANG